jgi:hypothetical protein
VFRDALKELAVGEISSQSPVAPFAGPSEPAQSRLR